MSLETFFFKTGEYSLFLAILSSTLAILIHKVKHDESSLKRIQAAEKTVLMISLASFLLLTAWIVVRALRTGHFPFTSMYEFSVAFVWGILLISNIFLWKYQNFVMNLAGFVVGALLMLYAGTLSAEAAPLVPALQNSLLLSSHVFSAVIAYGAFTTGFVASLLLLLQKNDRFHSLPSLRKLETISYHSVIIGFPFMTLVIVLGAIWADIAWGGFWSWDPKETASLVTWLIYAGYLHTRILRKWRGKKSAVLLIIGFIAVLFTFFGNNIFGGLHSYM